MASRGPFAVAPFVDRGKDETTPEARKPVSELHPDVKAAVAAERHDLAAVIAALPAPMWDAPTLCAGWRVREVVAHMTMPFRYSTPKIAVELLKARGSFNRMADRAARRDAASLSAAELSAVLTASVHHPWKPPGGGLEGALSHDMIHGLDITVALGITRRVPEERLRIVLPDLCHRNGSSTLASICLASNFGPTTWTGHSARVRRYTAQRRTCSWSSAVANWHPSGCEAQPAGDSPPIT